MVTELKEATFDSEEENGGAGIDQSVDEQKSRERRERDVVIQRSDDGRKPGYLKTR